ncbi:hypothetical protein QYM36_018221, partial [Artemia franciscana]
MGEDLVHNKMLRALPLTFLVPLLYLFNRCWESGSVPSACKSSILVPIYKGKGDRSDPASYRLIALTSCIAKLYEKMIKLRFEPLIDNSLIAEQAGFRKDDLALWTEGSSPEACQPKLQGAIDKLSIWLNTKNLVFSIPKTTGMVFSRKIDPRQDCPSINLTLYKQQIHFARNVKFLGMWLDSKLNWNDHISYLCDTLEKQLNFMRAVAGQKWGASRDGHRKLFTSIIYGKIEYCLPVYYSASKKLISKIESIVHHGLRLITGALKSTPIAALFNEVNIPSLEERFLKLSSNYFMK